MTAATTTRVQPDVGRHDLVTCPVPIGDQVWPQGTAPLVSICCITYNHGPFIRQCLDGFLMQETTFPVEILIHDDASTDDTAAVIREYTARHPQLFKPILQTQNQYSKGVRPNVQFNLPRVKGKYIAICEGDDYWTDPGKLALQVNVMDANPHSVGCFHDVLTVYDDRHRQPHLLVGKDARATVKLEDLLTRNAIPMLSVLYRAGLYDKLPEWYYRMPFGDWPLHLLNAQRGIFIYIPEVMAVYRVHKGGVWSGTSRVDRLQKTITLLHAFNKHLDYRHNKEINRKIAWCHYRIASDLSRQGHDREVKQHLAKSLGGIGRGVPLKGILKLTYRHATPWLYARTHWRFERLGNKLQWRRRR